MALRITLVFYFLSIVLFNSIYSQEINFSKLNFDTYHFLKNYSVENGLPSSEVYDVIQDKNGYIWFATDRGLSKFNGYDFTNYTTEDGLLNDVNFELFKDAKGNLWVLSIEGSLLHIDNGVFKEYEHNQKLIENLPTYKYSNSIIIDSNENLHFGTIGNGQISISKKGDIKKYTSNSSSSNITIKNINNRSFTFRNIIPQSGNELDYIYNDSVILRSSNQKAYSLIRSKSYFTSDSLLCFNTSNSIVIYNWHDFSIVDEVIFNNRITDFERSAEGEFFIGTERSGLYIYIISNNEFVEKNHILKNLTISKTMKDSEGGYWITSTQEGVFYTPSFNTTSLNKSNGLLDNYINEISLFNNFIAMSFGDSMQFLNKNKISDAFPLSDIKNNKKNNIHNFLRLSDCDLLYSGKKIYDLCNGFIYPNVLNSGLRTIKSINNKVYIFNKNFGVKYEENNFSKIEFNGINSIIEDVEIVKENTFWIGTRDGLFKQTDGYLEKMSDHNNLFSNRIIELELNNKNDLIIATKNKGLLILKSNNEVIEINKGNGLINNHLTCLHIDSLDNIWVGTTKGVNRIASNNYNHVDYFSINNGLISNEINDIKSIKEQLYIATKKGLYLFNLNTYKTDSSAINLRIENIKLNGSKINNDQSIDLYPGNKKLDVSYVGINYKSLGNIQYKYRLKGISNKWEHTNNHLISLHTLPENGEIDLEISARKLPLGKWSIPIVLKLILHPPFYKKWWFITALIVVIIGLIYIAFKVNIIAYNRHIQQKITDNILKALGKKSYLTIEADKTKIRIELNGILFMQAFKDYVEIHTLKKVFLYRSTMKELEKKLKNSNCIRVHRSYIVNIDKIDSIKKDALMINDKTIPIGVTYQKKLKNLSTQFSRLNM
jgi:ligand-binding sensor domain-containing protein